jgi:hypothetical protein
MFLKPAKGVLVRDPKTKRHLPTTGAEVQLSSYWVRRLADGDVVEVKQIPDSSAVIP